MLNQNEDYVFFLVSQSRIPFWMVSVMDIELTLQQTEEIRRDDTKMYN